MKKRDRRNLGLIILFISPCGLVYLLTAEEMTSERWLLLVVVAGWLMAGMWNLITGRSLVADVAPFLIMPFGIFTLLGWVLRRLWGVLHWVGNVFSFILGRQGEFEIISSVPPDWDTLIVNEAIQRKLLSGRLGVLGYNDKRVVTIDWNDTEHLLITGVTGYGKTTVAWSVILSMLLSGPSSLDRMEFQIHDPKGVVGLHFRPLMEVFPDRFRVFTQGDQSGEALTYLVEEMKERTHRLGAERVLEVDDLGLRHRLIVIDEPQLWYGRKGYQNNVMELVTAGRQAGFHMVLMTPYAKGDVINTSYRVNFKRITSKLPPHTILRGGGMEGFKGAPHLGKFEFLYMEDEASLPIFFKTYHIQPAHIEWIVGRVLYSPEQAEEIGVYLFVTKPGCGRRTWLREGVAHCQALVDAGKLKQIPKPWSEVRPNGKGFEYMSADAWRYAEKFFSQLEAAGIAGPAHPGQAREVKARGLTDALVKWKLYKENGNYGT